jgi:hypothetical protein
MLPAGDAPPVVLMTFPTHASSKQFRPAYASLSCKSQAFTEADPYDVAGHGTRVTANRGSVGSCYGCVGEACRGGSRWAKRELSMVHVIILSDDSEETFLEGQARRTSTERDSRLMRGEVA